MCIFVGDYRKHNIMSNAQLSYNQNVEKMRAYSSVFSRMSLLPVAESGSLDFLKVKIQRYDKDKIGKKVKTYLDYIKLIYKELSKNYCCEYIYKNTLVAKLLKEYGTNQSIILNEFRVGSSVADIVMFNGTSKAFEIKTELDSNKRLNSQLSDYSKIFRESYIVTHESLADKYAATTDVVGIIAMTSKNGKLFLEEKRPAIENKSIDVDVLMCSIRTGEYKNIVMASYGVLPAVSSFEMFNACKAMIKMINSEELHNLFLAEMKKRESNTGILKSYAKELRQFCLCTHLEQDRYNLLYDQLNNQIIL